jgi:outer membrane receptor protein involved in Fe transport
MAIARGERPLAPRLRLSATAHLGTTRTRSTNGDQRDWVACTANPGALCASDDAGAETPIVDRTGAPVPFDSSFDAADNRTDTRQTTYGAAGQLAVEAPLAARENHLFLGADGGQSRIRFRAQSTVATLDDARSTVDAGFLDPTSSIAVDSVVDDLGVYATDTLALRPDLFLMGAGRFNLTSLSLEDRLGAALSGEHAFHRINPGGGLSYQPRPWLGGYVGYGESNRAPTAVELTCASPTAPCRLPNAFAADPPLAQVVARTLEAGVRGARRGSTVTWRYALTAFRTTSSDDILFITSGAVANQGYFANVGQTRRQGFEVELSGRLRIARASHLELAIHETLTDATFDSAFSAPSATHPDAVNGLIAVPAGAHIPSIPRHIAKVSLSFFSAAGVSAAVNAIANGSQYLRGDEANLLAPIPGYIVFNARVGYRVSTRASVFVLVNNVFDARYSTFGVLGDARDVLGPSYDSPRFLAPGAPRAVWAGVDLSR